MKLHSTCIGDMIVYGSSSTFHEIIFFLYSKLSRCEAPTIFNSYRNMNESYLLLIVCIDTHMFIYIGSVIIWMYGT